jgi:thiol-disulfide isomerase/thioredoxin
MKTPYILLSHLLAGCATADQVKGLEEKVTKLEEKVATLEKAPPAAAAGKTAATAANSAEETAARELLTSITNLMKENKMDEAKAKYDELNKKYAATQTGKRAKRIGAELEVIGKPAPAELKVEKWLQGEGEISLSNGKPTLVVFWEIWCPHCKREVPQLQATYDEMKSKGLQVVGLTKLTRNKTEEEVKGFLAEKNVSYPVAKETGDMSKVFNVSGIPAAAVVKDGKIIWRGHPARLSKEMLESWL